MPVGSIQCALISVSDKKGVVELAQHLVTLGIEILATGGTATLLKSNQIAIIEVSDYTGFPEIMDGRLKTLHPKIHGGLLGRRGIDETAMKEHGIGPIDLLIVNLYPFQATIQRPDCTFEKAIENIDIGGPTLLRAAAKNHISVTAIVDPSDYAAVIEEITQHGNTTLETRKKLAAKVFQHTAEYDAVIANYLNKSEQRFTDHLNLNLHKQSELRYGENPHQQAAFYVSGIPEVGTLATAQQAQGKPLSFNNLVDASAALNAVRAFNPEIPACIIVKHATPCGVALGTTLLEAYEKAYKTDPNSAFGGIIAFNQMIDAATAEKIIQQQFVEVIIAPAAHSDALNIIAKKPNCRLLIVDNASAPQHEQSISSISGGFLIQERDISDVVYADLKVVTKRKPSNEEMKDLLFAWKVVKFVKSNAIVYAKNEMTLGVGTGQTSRVFAAKIAALKAEEAGLSLTNAVVASDAFFPFADGVEIAAQYGIKAIIQPGGSMRDDEVIAAADTLGMTMVFTGMRHFFH